ncbi:MAG: hypothetical protein AAFY41_11050, partial [Bacteroidota bacterium]
YIKDSLFHRIPVTVVEFYPTNSKGEVHGKILVDKKNFAVLHIDYTPDASNSKLWNQVTWTEEFMYKAGRYELSKVMFEGLCSKNTYKYTATLVMQQMKTLNQIPEGEQFLDKDVSLFEHAIEDFNEDFWEGYQDLKVNVDSEHVVHIASN